MDKKLEHSFASASTEDISHLHYSSSSPSETDSDAFRSSDDPWFMENHQINHLYIPRSTNFDTYMSWFEQFETDISRVVYRTRIEPNYWTSLSAEEQQKFM